jgi:eukaryotic-like serine/threonine-protein kinase
VSRIRRRKEGGGFWASRRGRTALLIGGVAIGAFVLGFVATAMIWRLGGTATSVVSVPDVRHRTEGEARRLASRAGLELEVGSSIVHPTAPEGSVLAQVPLPGHEVQPGTSLRVTMSAGPAHLTMPELAGRRVEQARQVLEGLGFQVAIDEQRDQAPAGQVIGVQPAPGSAVELPATARLAVSSGPPLVEVPFLLGMGEDEAVETLNQAGLGAAVQVVSGSFVPEAVVVSQRPAAGDSVRAGGSVTVQVARGFQ